MARATILDVAKRANVSVSTVNRAIHEPDKLRKEMLSLIMEAAEAVNFYGLGTLKTSQLSTRRKVRLGFLLLQGNRILYRTLNNTLMAVSESVHTHDVTAYIEHMDVVKHQNVVEGLIRLSETCNAIAVVSAEHPTVSAAIESLAEKNVKVFALISQLSARADVGYVGLDNWKVGRTAGWAFDNICKNPGKIAILVGNHRYRSQETNESGFRSYFREHFRGFEILEAHSTFETASIAEEITEQILQQHPDLIGLYISGGGLSGALSSLRESGRASEIVTVAYEFNEITRGGLIDGSINFLISHPLQLMAQELVAAMIRSVDGGRDFPPPIITLPFEIYTPENL